MDKRNKIAERLKDLKINALRRIAKDIGLSISKRLTAQELIDLISEKANEDQLNKILKIETSKSRKRNILRSLYFIAGFVALVAGLNADLPGLFNSIKKISIADGIILEKIPRIDNGNTIKVLILPFQNYYEKSVVVGKAINSRLNNLKVSGSIDLSSYYFEDYPISGNFNSDSALMILDVTGYDMIIYGYQIGEDCGGDVENKLCINYQVNQNYRNYLSQRSQNTDMKFAPFSIMGLFEGQLQGDIDYIVYRIKAILESFNGNNTEALASQKIIYDSLKIKNETSLEELVILLLYCDKYNEAIIRIEAYQEGLLPPSLEDLLYINSLKVMTYGRENNVEKLKEVLTSSETIFSQFLLPKNIHTAERFHKIGEFVSPHFPDYAIQFIDSALKIFEEFKILKEIPKCFQNLGLAYFYKGNYLQSIKVLEKALTFYSPDKFEDKWLIIRANQLIGMCFIRLEEYWKGQRKMKKVIGLIEEIHNDREVIVIQSITAKELIDKKEYSKAIPWLKKSIKLVAALENFGGKALIKFNLEKNLGITYNLLDKVNKAEEYFNNAKKTWITLPNKSEKECLMISEMYIYWVNMYEDKGDKEKAKTLANESMSFFKECSK